MASKQLGKLRQWAGEVISKSEKTQVSGEFITLEQDIEMRRKGMERLHVAAEDYHAYISRKVQSEALRGDEKVMHSEALGIIMIGHGEELSTSTASQESVFGAALTSYGRARCRIAAQQEIFAVTYADSFLAYIQRSIAELEEYAVQRKKLESRRLTLDAAISKVERAPSFKKEKDKKEAEEELEVARERYDETAEDVKVRMDTIREGDLDSLRELGGFLDMEVRFVEQYLEALKEVKAEWPDVDYSTLKKPAVDIASPHIFARKATRSSTSLDSPKSTAPPLPSSRFGSYRSMRSVRSNGTHKDSAKSVISSVPNSESESEDDEAMATPRRSRSKSISRPKEHSRSNSVAGTGNDELESDDADEMDSRHRRKKSTASGVASWVGGAFTGVMSRGKRDKESRPDKESFATLGGGNDSDDNDVPSRPRSAMSNRSMKSNRSTKSTKSSGKAKSRTGSFSGSRNLDGVKEKKVMKAVFDFFGSNDELSFKTGDEIIVLQEVLDGWWLGEAGGKKGLFPTNYAVVVSGKADKGDKEKARNNSPSKSAPGRLPSRSWNASTSSVSKLAQLTRGGVRNRDSGYMDDEEESRRTLFGGKDSGYGADSASEISHDEHEHGEEESVDGLHPFGDHHRSPVQERSESGGSFFNRKIHGAEYSPSDSDSYTGSLEAAPIERRIPLISAAKHAAQIVADLSSSSASSDAPAKRMPPPPPPPPRRKSMTSGQPAPPPLPARNPSSTTSAPLMPSRTHSSSVLLQPVALPGLTTGLDSQIRRSYSENNSPFESTSELSFDAVAMTGLKETRGVSKCTICSCSDFVVDPFHGHNACVKCNHTHA